MQLTDQLLQVSANLYKILGEDANGEERDDLIEKINAQLDKRGKIIEGLEQEGFSYDAQNRVHRTLFELDNGIRERLSIIMDTIKQEMNTLQKAKKSEEQYFNPYASVRVMDGMYYDKKK
ncbi:MAG: flagellar protein FliT [Lysinibacillus sp.]